MKKFIIICVTLAVVLTAGSDAFAKSKKYYEYKLKAYPAYKDSKSDKVRRVLGYLGDHTYVCLKGKKKKYGKYSTTKNYGCFSRSGRNYGGTTRAKWKVRKSSASKERIGELFLFCKIVNNINILTYDRGTSTFTSKTSCCYRRSSCGC